MDFFEFDDTKQHTTAIYPNRVMDKAEVETFYGLPEFGNATRKFYTKNGTLFAIGYIRVVYGDHGPYVEFERKHIKAVLMPKFAGEDIDPARYYEWLYPTCDPTMKVYDQKRDVKKMKNPPEGGFRGNRAEGYADYEVGMIYVSPYDFANIELYEQTKL
jgi:hypothetical protein